MSTTLQTRVQSKRDTSTNWTQNNPVLLDGEVIVVDTNSGDVRFKVGNGTSTYTQLPFQDENIYTELNSKLTTPSGNQGQFLGYISDNIVGALEAPSGAFSYSGILTSTWISSGQQYYQQFSIPEITSDEVPLVIPQWSSNKANEQKVWNDLEIQSFNGYVRIYATKKSSVNIKFILICNKTS